MGMFDSVPMEKGMFDAVPMEASPRPTVLTEDLMRSGGLALRAGGLPLAGAAAGAAAGSLLGGVGAVPGAAAGLAAGSIASLADKLFGGSGEKFADWLGLPRPTAEGEKLGSAAVEGSLAALSGIGGGALMAKAANPVVAGVGKALAAGPQVTLPAGALSGAAGEQVRLNGGGPLESLAAEVAVPVATTAAMRPVTALARGVKNMADSLLLPGGAERSAGRVIVDAAKGKAEALSGALLRGTPSETAAQAAADLGSAELSGLERSLASYAPSVYGPVGSNASTQEQFINNAWRELNAATAAMREAELNAANVGGTKLQELRRIAAEKKASFVSALQNQGRMQTEQAQQLGYAEGQRPTPPQMIGRTEELPAGNFPSDPSIVQPTGDVKAAFPVPGQPRVPPRYSAAVGPAEQFGQTAEELAALAAQRRSEAGFAQRVADSIGAHGMQPLSGQAVINELTAALQSVKVRSNPVARRVLQQYIDEIGRYTSPETGIADAHDLYNTRKYMSQIIDGLMKSEGWDKRTAAGHIATANKAIDEAIGRASGTLRKDGTSDWTDYLKAYSAKAQEIDAIRNRAVKSEEMGRVGAEEARRIFNADEVPFTFPNLLSRPIMALNAGLRIAEGRAGENTRNALIQLMAPENKAKLAQLLAEENGRRLVRQPLSAQAKQALLAGVLNSAREQ